MRTSGILMPVFSLPSPYGIGCFSGEAEGFIDKLAAAGQRYWQVLPLGRTGGWYSPYQPLSCFAIDPMFIDPAALIAKGAVSENDAVPLKRAASEQRPARIDYETILPLRMDLYRKAYRKIAGESAGGWTGGSGGSGVPGGPEAERSARFRANEAYWLGDYALFAALKDRYGTGDWSLWPEELKRREPAALEKARKDLAEDIGFYEWLQFEAYTEWRGVVRYAHERGVEIIGDIPIYAAYESADCWAAPELFDLDRDLRPAAVAGCPPDAFSEDGQIWGNPLYRWRVHKSSGFDWWIRRLGKNFELFDIVRLDHMRGFESFFSIPADAETAAEGKWVRGPDMSFFRAVEKELPAARFIAEDLGYITPRVERLIKKTGLPGMKVLQFAFDSDGANPYLPDNITDNCVMYTGTHDNDTTRGWYMSLDSEEKKKVTAYIRGRSGAVSEKSAMAPEFPSKQAAMSLILLAMESRADTCIIPMGDCLLADSTFRINTPGTVGDNWRWRMGENVFTDHLASYFLQITKASGRAVQSR